MREFRSSTAWITMCFGVSWVPWGFVVLIPRFLSGLIVSHRTLVSAGVGEARCVEDVLGPPELEPV
jgi:hypothetical protein